MLEILADQKKVVGIKQTTKALHDDKIKVLFIAEDAEKNLIDHMVQLAMEKTVEVVRVESMNKLGKACGIDVGAAVAAVLK